MRSGHARPRQAAGRLGTVSGWTLPLAILLAGLGLELGGERLRSAARYARAAIADGELWRLLSGHFVHLGWSHYAMNAAALVLVWLLVGDRLRTGQWLLATAVIVAGIDAGFWLLEPGLVWYVGLSGLLHGLYATGALAALRRAPREASVLLGLLAAKLAFEQLAGPVPGAQAAAGGPVVVAAHLYGAVAGALAAAALGAGRRA